MCFKAPLLDIHTLSLHNTVNENLEWKDSNKFFDFITCIKVLKTHAFCFLLVLTHFLFSRFVYRMEKSTPFVGLEHTTPTFWRISLGGPRHSWYSMCLTIDRRNNMLTNYGQGGCRTLTQDKDSQQWIQHLPHMQKGNTHTIC